ncbi:MAG: transporter substrate-binding domain-containing protein [Lentisphaerae bacterium]|nr:transporter substrate-binding domain-containing protein [Lentisphaerota bacterium]
MIKRLFLILAFLTVFPLFAKDAVRVVTSANFAPYEYYEGDKIVGIDIDIITEIFARHGKSVIVEDMKFDAVIVAIQTGKGDVAASGLTVTEDRKKEVDFSIPYVSAKQVIIVPVSSPVKGAADLKGKRIGVQSGTTGDSYVTDNIDKNPQRFDDASTAVASLLKGKLDAVVLDVEPANVHASKHKSLTILAEPLTTEEYAFAVAKGQEGLLNMLNCGLQQMIDDGTLDSIREKYDKKTQNIVQETLAESEKSGGWNDFYTNFIKFDRWNYLWEGFQVTMIVAMASVLLGVFLGFLVAVIRSTADITGKLKTADWFCRLYLTVIRGTPVVLQLMIIYFVVFGSVNVPKIVVAIIAFGINSGAYVAEIIRSGIMSIDRGQMEAGRSLGLSYSKTMTLVILPQAFKNVLPALGNEFIVLLKETSVCGFIALQDLTKGGDIIRSQTYNAFMPLIAVALIYLFLVMIFSRFLAILEKRLKKNE